MRPSPSLRKAALTAHVVASVGWLGAVAAFLAITVVGLSSDDPETVRGAYLVMEPAAKIVLVPLAFAALATGLVQGFVTPWGVIRHYWVVFKLVITVFATAVLLLYLKTFRSMADAAADPNAASADVRSVSPALHAGAALGVLVAATVLSVFKPRGLTRFGQRHRRIQS
jgi:hypothetical protein